MFLDINDTMDVIENGEEKDFMIVYFGNLAPIRIDLNRDIVYENVDSIDVSCDSQSTEYRRPKGRSNLGNITYKIPKNSIGFIEFR